MKYALLTAGAIAALTTATAQAQETAPPPAMPASPATMPPANEPVGQPPAPEATTPTMPPEATMPPATSPEATMPPATPPEAAAPAPASPEAATGATMSPEAAQAPADWAQFDNGNKGYLDALEFGNWMMAKQGNDMSAQVNKTRSSKAANLPAVKVLNATGSAFLKADKNGDRHITPDELAGAVAG